MRIFLAIACGIIAAVACLLADLSARREVEFGAKDNWADVTGIGSACAYVLLCVGLAGLIVL